MKDDTPTSTAVEVLTNEDRALIDTKNLANLEAVIDEGLEHLAVYGRRVKVAIALVHRYKVYGVNFNLWGEQRHSLSSSTLARWRLEGEAILEAWGHGLPAETVPSQREQARQRRDVSSPRRGLLDAKKGALPPSPQQTAPVAHNTPALARPPASPAKAPDPAEIEPVDLLQAALRDAGVDDAVLARATEFARSWAAEFAPWPTSVRPSEAVTLQRLLFKVGGKRMAGAITDVRDRIDFGHALRRLYQEFDAAGRPGPGAGARGPVTPIPKGGK